VSSFSSESLEKAVAAIRVGAEPVEVAGDGPLAARLRERASLEHGSPSGRPRTVVDTTGDLAKIERLLARVADLGTVVLAGPPLAPEGTIDLYSDVHVRGLTVIALAAPGEGE
jgi:hypothetical protein